MTRAFLALGSNLGDRDRYLADAIAGIPDVVAVSPIYETGPVGGSSSQGPYLNAAVLLDCDLPPMALLERTQEIEDALGRDRPNEVRWGPRTLDLDLLMAGARGEVIVDEPTLRLPHPRMKERGFALAPLLDLDATLMHPELLRPLKALLPVAHAAGQAWAPTGDTL